MVDLEQARTLVELRTLGQKRLASGMWSRQCLQIIKLLSGPAIHEENDVARDIGRSMTENLTGRLGLFNR